MAEEADPKKLAGAGKSEKEKEQGSEGVEGSKDASNSKPKDNKGAADKRLNKVLTREKMRAGDLIKSETACWKIIRLLGSGGFGDVYKVKKDENPEAPEYAMKTELTTGDKHLLRLKIELVVLEVCSKFKPDEGKKSHFVECIDRGITPKFKFVVMSLVGPSLEDIRRQFLVKNFNKSTAMQASMQTLKAIKDLHSLGWLHRDIKPANFAVGLGDEETHIYMLDFGIARRFVKPDTENKVKIPRAKVKFLGTLRFASRACHNCIEQARKDDLETWLYMVYDLFDDECGLPWKKIGKKNLVIQGKDNFFAGKVPPMTYRFVPAEMKHLVSHIGKLTYYDAPDYDALTAALSELAKQDNIDVSKKLEWTGQLKKKKDVKKKKVTVDEEEDEANPSKKEKEPSKEEQPEQ